jgi:tRNA (adenine57-N1/adenine58-N1)-methyltransferase
MSQEDRPFRPSPFLDPGSCSSSDSLAVLQLKRDHLIATKLSDHDENHEGYDEGRVTNTRFGSFPHSTLIDLPWGSQVRASKVDTGSRGRRPVESTKRKREDSKDIETPESSKLGKSTAKPVIKKPVVADTGFVHLLPPTPEYWTASLPHRTQVVYTPDYSYVLHRLRVRPGDVLVEAGAGSGSFTHAAARSVFNGYSNLKSRNGHIYSYEFHEQRAEKIRTEIEEHRLQSIVEVNHRDVCEDGFYVCDDMKVTVIFLDLPAPW